jgi:hypothetical protein
MPVPPKWVRALAIECRSVRGSRRGRLRGINDLSSGQSPSACEQGHQACTEQQRAASLRHLDIVVVHSHRANLCQSPSGQLGAGIERDRFRGQDGAFEVRTGAERRRAANLPKDVQDSLLL